MKPVRLLYYIVGARAVAWGGVGRRGGPERSVIPLAVDRSNTLEQAFLLHPLLLLNRVYVRE